jgi:hypothetical protein
MTVFVIAVFLNFRPMYIPTFTMKSFEKASGDPEFLGGVGETIKQQKERLEPKYMKHTPRGWKILKDPERIRIKRAA